MVRLMKDSLLGTQSILKHLENWTKLAFDIDALTKSMNYKPVVAGNQSNGNAGTKECDDAGKARIETVPRKDYILLPLKKGGNSSKEDERADQEKDVDVNSTNSAYTISLSVNAVDLPNDLNMPELEEIGRYSDAEDDDSGADMNNLDTYFQ
ncbi:hypothetical protein Tco_0198524, partial [Tanacetum coccineum]